jgi:hypothetical protein
MLPTTLTTQVGADGVLKLPLGPAEANRAVRVTIEPTEPASAKLAEEKSPAERSAAWRSWVASHNPQLVIADDSRESIYIGRGE